MLFQSACLAAALLAAVPAARIAEPNLASAGGLVHAPCAEPALAVLLDLASEPVNSPTRREARDRLFREVVPGLRASGRGPTMSEARALLAGVGGYPCAGGELRLHEARLCGDAATVSLAAEVGGCSLFMRRRGARWEVLMVLGWTLGGG